jgi:hypothetical protein
MILSPPFFCFGIQRTFLLILVDRSAKEESSHISRKNSSMRW